MSSDVNKIITSQKINFQQKDLDKVQLELNKLKEEKKNTNPLLFDKNRQYQLNYLKERAADLKAQKQGRLVIDYNGQKYRVKESYLKGLKDPEKYLKGLYGRTTRQQQKKAYENKNYAAVSSLGKKLRALEQPQGVSKWKRTRSKNLEFKSAKQAFKKMGRKFDVDRVKGAIDVEDVRYEPESSMKVLATFDEEDGVLNILLV